MNKSFDEAKESIGLVSLLVFGTTWETYFPNHCIKEDSVEAPTTWQPVQRDGQHVKAVIF